MESLYFDCSFGISGDMAVAALLDLGADRKVLLDTLDSLPVDGYQIKISTVSKNGIQACDFCVLLDEVHETHDHDMEFLHGHHHTKPETISAHAHRNLQDVLHILKESLLTPRARNLACKIFEILAVAEAEAHGLSKEQVHFHEVGAVDSIIDIAAFAICMDNLGFTETIIPRLCDGHGQIRCQHGIIPVPVPAVVNIAKNHHLPLSSLNINGELVTPTGAAIAAATMTSQKLPEVYQILKTGIGAGKRNYETPGIFRVFVIL